jgi:hypothetical protein
VDVVEAQVTAASVGRRPLQLCNFEALRRAFDAVCRPQRPAPDDPGERLADELIEDFWKLSRDLDAALTPEVRHDLTTLVQHLSDNREAYAASLTAWVDLIEEVCLVVEVEYGDHTGALKLRRVRSVAFQLAQRFIGDAPLPDIPDFVRPFVIDLLTRTTVTFIIDLVNVPDPDRQLWRNVDTKPVRPSAVLAPLRSQSAVELGARVLVRHQSLLEAIISWLLRPPSLPARLQAKVDAILARWDAETAKTGQPPVQYIVRAAFEFLNWIGHHGPEIRAGVDALSIVIHWSFEFTELSREGRIDLIKRALARYFEELGIGGTLFDSLMRLAIDLVVDATIEIFVKRRVVGA